MSTLFNRNLLIPWEILLWANAEVSVLMEKGRKKRVTVNLCHVSERGKVGDQESGGGGEWRERK